MTQMRKILVFFVAGWLVMALPLSFAQSQPGDADEKMRRSLEEGRKLCQRIEMATDSFFLNLIVFQFVMRGNKAIFKEIERLKGLLLESRKLADQSRGLLDEAALTKDREERVRKIDQFLKVFTQADKKFGEALKGAKAIGESLGQECQPKIKI